MYEVTVPTKAQAPGVDFREDGVYGVGGTSFQR